MDVRIKHSTKPNPKQQDDGSRNALHHFMIDRDQKLSDFLKILIDKEEYWKGRVLLELLWEYESSIK